MKGTPVNNLMISDNHGHVPQLGGSQPGTVQNANQQKTHFIHEAIERKIERFSRQRNRGAS